MDNFEIDRAIAEVWGFVKECNKYVNDKKPWDNKDKADILYNLYESLRCISIILNAFVPETTEKISCQLGLKGCGSFKDIKFGKVKGDVIKGEVLFKKIE